MLPQQRTSVCVSGMAVQGHERKSRRLRHFGIAVKSEGNQTAISHQKQLFRIACRTGLLKNLLDMRAFGFCRDQLAPDFGRTWAPRSSLDLSNCTTSSGRETTPAAVTLRSKVASVGGKAVEQTGTARGLELVLAATTRAVRRVPGSHVPGVFQSGAVMMAHDRGSLSALGPVAAGRDVMHVHGVTTPAHGRAKALQAVALIAAYTVRTVCRSRSLARSER